MTKVLSHQETEKGRLFSVGPAWSCSADAVRSLFPQFRSNGARGLSLPQRYKSATWGLALGSSRGSLSPQGQELLPALMGPCRSVDPLHTGGQAGLALLGGRRTPGPGVPCRCLPGIGEPRGSWNRGAGGAGCGAPRRSDSLRHQVPSGAQPPPLTRAAGSSPWRRRPRTAEGRGQRQQIGELLGRRAQVSAQSHRTRDGEQGSRPGPPRLSTSPRPTGAGLQFPAVSVGPLRPRARHHGAPAQRLASAATRRSSAPRGAQPSRCEGEFPAGCAPQPP